MNHRDLHLVFEELPLGKCSMSLRTIILLNNEENIKFLNEYLKLSNYSINFYENYNDRYLTLDGLIYHDVNIHMMLAVGEGNLKIVKLMLEKGANDHDRFMRWAARNGHVEIVRLMLELGATEYGWPMLNAAEYGHLEIVELMLTKSTIGCISAMCHASVNGHTEIVNLLLSKMKT